MSSELEGSDMLKVQSVGVLATPLVGITSVRGFGDLLSISQLIFPKQPATLVYKITQITSAIKRSISQILEQRRLALVIEYSCLDEGM